MRLRDLLIASVLALAAAGCSTYHAGAQTAHFDGTHFYNSAGPYNRTWSDFWKWQFTREPEPWPDRIDDYVPSHPPAHVDGTQLLVTMIGHASVLLQTNGLNIITDPIWSERASPVSFAGPRRVRGPGVALEDLPKIDVVVISHNHYDHMDIPTLQKLWERDRPKMIMPLANDAILKDNIAGVETTALDWGGTVDLGNGVRAIATPVQHWSQRGMFDRNTALWAGWLIDAPGGVIFFAGDTGYGGGWWVDEVNKLAPGRIRLALLPIGAYMPRWFMAEAHVDPHESVSVFQRLKAEAALGIHWGTFPMADDGPERPLIDLKIAREQADVSDQVFRTLLPGETWNFE
jgi:L-ascorbate metabolism protein UlaG (beta-lactamase superfamily)